MARKSALLATFCIQEYVKRNVGLDKTI